MLLIIHCFKKEVIIIIYVHCISSACNDLSIDFIYTVCYVVGLGDRHIQNILVDKETAELIHIDLGIIIIVTHHNNHYYIIYRSCI